MLIMFYSKHVVYDRQIRLLDAKIVLQSDAYFEFNMYVPFHKIRKMCVL